SSQPVEAGDQVVLVKSAAGVAQLSDSSRTDSLQAALPIVPKEQPAQTKRSRSPFSGNLAFQYSYWNDQKGTTLDFSQPTLRLNLRGKKLWGKDYNLRIRARLRYNQRSVELNSNAPLEEWRNRLFELAFSYDKEDAPVNFQAGRIISNQFSGVGYIDGLLLQYNTSRNFHIGAFGGTQPQWQYSDFQTSIQKYGGYLNANLGNFSSGKFESTLAAVGEYHGSTVSREFIYIQNSFYQANRWSFYQNAEIDLNRDWRKNIAGEDISLTSFFLSAQWNATSRIIIGAMYDNRQNYLTYETRSLADSLFDEAQRQGLRGSVTFLLPQDYRIFGNFGIRKRDTDTESTVSYAAGLGKTNFLIPFSRISLKSSGFSNFYTRGQNYSLLWGYFLWNRVNTDLSFGGYQYDLKADSSQRTNQWIRGTVFAPLAYRLYLSGQYEYQWGDDLTGHRILGEIGVRF
ncbi:MAG: hypothetical protein HGA23_12010, partial [Bacteroidales bacterium]|nr:hypothetical protein [Bacteroidales bacterium]